MPANRMILAAAGVIFLYVAPALGFECLTRPGPMRERLPDAQDRRIAVFVGKVSRVDLADNRAFLQVIEKFTGPEPGAVIEVEGRYAESFRFAAGRTYLVEANRWPGESWMVTTCSHTRSIDVAADDLIALRAWKKGQSVPCNLGGLLWGRDGSEHRSGLKVQLAGKERSLFATSGADGRFLFKDVPAGVYRIAADGWRSRSLEVTAALCPNGDLYPTH